MKLKKVLAAPVIGLIVANLALIGCTRPAQEKSSYAISIALPAETQSHLKTLSTATLAHVVVNVSGDGIAQNILIDWDGHNGAPPPASFQVEVPQGSNRLFQVLSVYKSDDGGMAFFYGDASTNLDSENPTVTVPITPLATAGKTFSGDVAGRYFDSAVSGPTGMLEARLQPGNKPSMVISRSLMIEGWFRTFTLSGIPFTYKLTNGTTLFGQNGLTMDSPVFAPSQTVARIVVPAHRREEWVNGTSSLRPEEPAIQIWGFFGNPTALADRRVCVDRTATELSKMIHASAATSLALLYAGTPPADLFQPSNNAYMLGGLPRSNALCPEALMETESYQKILKITPLLMNGEGKDRAAGFEIPFRYGSTNRSLKVDGTNVTATLLPGLASHISSFKIDRKSVV